MKMIMKKSLIFVMAMMVGVFALAQNNDRKELAAKQAEKMKTELSLTDEQFQKIKQIQEKFTSSQARLLADTAMARENRVVERKRMNDERMSEIKGVLSEEQQKKWAEFREKQIRKDPSPRRVERAKNQMEELRTLLNLSDEQFDKVVKINNDAIAGVKTLRTDSSVSRENVRGEMRKIKEGRNTAMKAVLTEEQYQKFLAYEQEKNSQQRRGKDTPTIDRSKKG
jgi:hypothetical protein